MDESDASFAGEYVMSLTDYLLRMPKISTPLNLSLPISAGCSRDDFNPFTPTATAFHGAGSAVSRLKQIMTFYVDACCLCQSGKNMRNSLRLNS
jgi:hypothetical protein